MKDLGTSSSTLTAPSNGEQAPEQVQDWRVFDAVDVPGAADVIKERGKFFWFQFTPGITSLSGFCTAEQAAMVVAAPDMLAALIELIDIIQGVVDEGQAQAHVDSFTLQPARAAITKATGAT